MWPSVVLAILLTTCNSASSREFTGEKSAEANLDLFSHCDGTNMIFESETPVINSKFLQDSKITCLNLQNRGIIRVSPEAFNDVPNLENLNLANNKLKKEQFLSLGRHDNLKMLVLDRAIRGGYRNLTGFTGYIKVLELNGHFPKLEKLFLRNNSIGIIFVPPGSSFFPRLTHLWINNNEITNESPRFDRNFHWLPKSLQELHFGNNDLDYFGLGNFQSLEWISVDNNRISDITLRELPRLKYFSARDNAISWISDFSKSPLLEILDLSGNKIRHLNHIHKMPSLRHLMLDNNFLHSIPRIEVVPKLKSLTAKCNEIRSLTSWDFTWMSSLEELYLDSNRIRYIHKDAFEKMENLRIISLEQNKLMHIVPGWMVHLRSLRELNLKGNSFQNVKAMGLVDSGILEIRLDRNFRERLGFREKVPVNVTLDMDSDSVVRNCKKHVSRAIHCFDWVGYR